MPRKKNFTTADGAIDKLFTAPNKDDTKQAQDTIDTLETNISNNTNITHDENDTHISQDTNTTNDYKPANKSKHYDKRGKRAERFGLLLDEQLKEDLTLLSKAINSKSVNDLIVSALLEYVERQENQTKLKQYRKLLQG